MCAHTCVCAISDGQPYKTFSDWWRGSRTGSSFGLHLYLLFITYLVQAVEFYVRPFLVQWHILYCVLGLCLYEFPSMDS